MMDWQSKQIAKDWTAYFLPEDRKDTELWLMEHTVEGCGGVVTYEQEPKECSLCKTPVPSKLMLAITMLLKKDLVRV